MILLAILFVLAGCASSSTIFGAQGGSHGGSGGVRWSVPVK